MVDLQSARRFRWANHAQSQLGDSRAAASKTHFDSVEPRVSPSISVSANHTAQQPVETPFLHTTTMPTPPPPNRLATTEFRKHPTGPLTRAVRALPLKGCHELGLGENVARHLIEQLLFCCAGLQVKHGI